MPQISHPIPKADLDFYEGHLISVTARAMAGTTEQTWKAMRGAQRTSWRDKALPVVYQILADKDFVTRLPLLTRNLQNRL